MNTALEWAKLLGGIVALLAVGEIPLVKTFAYWIDQSRPWLFPLTLGVSVVGFLVLLGGAVIVGAEYGRPMSDSELDRLSARTQILSPGPIASTAWFKGWRRGRQIDPPMEWPLRELKDAWRSGTLWSDGDMRRKLVITVGGTMTIFGMFSLLMVLFRPSSVKLLLAATMVYAIVRLTDALLRA